MKYKLLFICFVVGAFIYAFKQVPQTPCPPNGDNPKASFQNADKLKNRLTTDVKFTPVAYTAEQWLKLAPDAANKLSTGAGAWVSLTCYICAAKMAGKESCECHSVDKTDIDYHIECGITAKALRNQYIICEVNRFNKKEHPVLTFAYVKSLIGKKVIITGWRFYDTEHENAADNIKHRTTNWRGTCTEVHSIQSITLAK